MAAAMGVPTRSVGLKFLLVCVLTVLMALPAFVIFGMISEREGRASSVVAEVGQRFGGEQTFTGPILAAPFRQIIPAPPATTDNPRPTTTVRTGWYVVFPKTGKGEAKLVTDVKTRGSGGLFKVRTYRADVSFTGAFALGADSKGAPDAAVIDWSRAALLIGVSDPRGAAAAAQLTVSGKTVPLEPGSAYADVFAGATPSPIGDPNVAVRPFQWLVAPAGDIARPGASFNTSADLQFTGVERVGLVPFARDTDLRLSGDWGVVSYEGAFPRKGDDDAAPAATAPGRFDARWTVPFIARNLAEAGDSQSLGGLGSLAVQVRLLDPANPYLSIERALKYALMFLGVVFLAYFLMEATSDRRMHPAQYILVGLAQLIFYLLLLSISERIGFDLAFLIAAAATVTLIGAYAGAVFRSALRGLIASVAFAALYALIYLLMRLEDYALLAGSVAAFVAVTAVMWFTRNLDWYGLVRGPEPPRPPRP